jgi:hypothetical protein
MLHHHEYVTPAEYEHGSFFFRFLHRLEKRILPLASWISHTNRDRLQFFSKDMGLSDNFPCRILPNYPPAKWTVKSLKEELELPLKIVYLGALSEDTMYLKEFADWVIKQGGKVCWDIYSMQPDPAVLNYLLSLSSPYIRLKGSLDYESIPSVLRNYDVGVILYKGHIPNYVYNAPNKMFEYHVSGLDVWLPGVMVGARPYLTSVTYPKILSLDFEHLDRLDLSLLTARKGLAPKIGDYSCEKVLSSIYDELENA